MSSAGHGVGTSYSRVRSRSASSPNVSHGSQNSAAASFIRLRPMQQGNSESRGSRTHHYPERVSPNDIMMYSLDHSVGKVSRGSPPEHLQVKQSVAYSNYGKVDELDGDSQYPVSTSFPLGPYDETYTITNSDPRTTQMRTNERPGARLNNHRLLYQHGSLLDSHWHGAALPGLRHKQLDSPLPAHKSQTQQWREEKVDSARQSRVFKPSRHYPKQSRHQYTSPCAGDNQMLGESGEAIAQKLLETRKSMQGLATSCTSIRLERNCMNRQRTNSKDGGISFGHQCGSAYGSRELDDNDDGGIVLIGPPKIKNIWRDFTASCGLRELQSPCGGLFTHIDDRHAERGNIRRPRGAYDFADTVLADRLDDDSGTNLDHSSQHVMTVTDTTQGASPSNMSNYVTSSQKRTQWFQDSGDTRNYPQTLEEFLLQDPSTHLFQVESNSTPGGLEKTESENQQSQLISNQHTMDNSCFDILSEDQLPHEVKITIRQPAEVSPMDTGRLCSTLHDNRVESELRVSPPPSENASLFLRCPDIDGVIDEEIFKFSSDVSVLRAEVLDLQAQWAGACAERLASEKEKERAVIEREKARKEAFDLKDHVYQLAAAFDSLREQHVRKAQQSEEEAQSLKRELGEIRQLISTNR